MELFAARRSGDLVYAGNKYRIFLLKKPVLIPRVNH
jgi:hypothetical protein